MLYLEPVEGYRKTIPKSLLPLVDALNKEGFDGSVAGTLRIVNLARRFKLVESAGRIDYVISNRKRITIGYVRARYDGR